MSGILLHGRRLEADAHHDKPGASVLHLGVRQVRMDFLRGPAPKVEVALMVTSTCAVSIVASKYPGIVA